MYKVLIIDDEPFIRKGLRNIIDWTLIGCKLIGEATNGVEGCKMVEKERPDIIITDIKMPGMDGLTMIRNIKKFIPDSKIIILTGYRDFDYIHEGMKLGALDFLLKPSKIKELNRVLKRAVKELRFQRDKEEEILKLRELFEENVPQLKEKLIYDIIYCINIDERDILEKMALFKMHIGKFVFILVESDVEEKEKLSQYDSHLYQYGIINTFDETFSEKFETMRIAINNKQIGFILQNLGEEPDIIPLISEKCEYILNVIENCFDVTVTVSISNLGDGPFELAEKFNMCREAMKYKYYVGNSSIVSYKELSAFNDFVDFSVLEKKQALIIEAIKAYNLDYIKNGIEDYIKILEKISSNKSELVKRNCLRLLQAINEIDIMFSDDDKNKKFDNVEYEKILKSVKENMNISDVRKHITEYALNVTAKVNYFNNRKINFALQKAIDFVKKNYHEQITLDQVANHVYFSSYYVSRLFKKVIGKNFVEYLNEIRIEKAKELLKDVQYKAYEVADMVGIQNSHYFSKIFKKYTGMSPTEYRETIGK